MPGQRENSTNRLGDNCCVKKEICGDGNGAAAAAPDAGVARFVIKILEAVLALEPSELRHSSLQNARKGLANAKKMREE